MMDVMKYLIGVACSNVSMTHRSFRKPFLSSCNVSEDYGRITGKMFSLVSL